MKTQFGAIIVTGSGKLGGHVGSKNRGGSYLRTKVTPSNGRTIAQQTVRNRLSTNAQAWSGITEAQRLSFNNAKQDFPRVKNGKVSIPSGFDLFVELRNNLGLAGQTLITSAPNPVAMPNLILTTLASSVGGPSITITANQATVPAGFTMAVFATGLYRPGRYNVKNRFRFIGTTTLSSSTANVYTLWNAKFGTLTQGQKISVQIKLISNTTGQSSVPSAAEATVGA